MNEAMQIIQNRETGFKKCMNFNSYAGGRSFAALNRVLCFLPGTKAAKDRIYLDKAVI
jgi:hypothetical protein